MHTLQLVIVVGYHFFQQNQLTIAINKMITSDKSDYLIDHIRLADDQNELHDKALPVTRFGRS